MNDNRKGLDEMQRQKRNSIGNQMFILMIFALYADSLLHGAGVKWVSYPANIMVIVTVCLGIYLIRLIGTNAYLPASKTNINFRLAIAGVVSVILAIVAAVFMLQSSPVEVVETTNDNGALIMMIASGVGLICALIIALIKRANNKNSDDD